MRILTEMPSVYDIGSIAFSVLWETDRSIQSRQLSWKHNTGELEMYDPNTKDWFLADTAGLQRDLNRFPHVFLIK